MSRTTHLSSDSEKLDEPSSVGTWPRRVFRWGRENRWYLAATFVVLMMARSEAKRAETPAMQRNRETIEAMSRIERDRLRHNHQQFQKLTASDLKRVKAIHHAVNSEPQLAETVSQFHTWLATLPLSDREELLALSDPEDRLQMIRRLQAETGSGRFTEQIPPSSEMGARLQYSNLRVSPQDYSRMMRAAAEWAEPGSEPDAKTPVERLAYHTSVLAEIMDRIVPQWRFPGGRTGNRPRPSFPDDLRHAVLTQLTDPVMKRMIQSRPSAQQNMLAMMLLARGLLEESHSVIRSLRPTDAELDRVYQNLPEPRRRVLDSMSKEAADRQLQQQWLSRRLPAVAGENLSRLAAMFEKLLTRSPSGSRNGPGMKGSGRRDIE